jgi:hypothetical protein
LDSGFFHFLHFVTPTREFPERRERREGDTATLTEGDGEEHRWCAIERSNGFGSDSPSTAMGL